MCASGRQRSFVLFVWLGFYVDHRKLPVEAEASRRNVHRELVVTLFPLRVVPVEIDRECWRSCIGVQQRHPYLSELARFHCPDLDRGRGNGERSDRHTQRLAE